jgi:hypothetical protein
MQTIAADRGHRCRSAGKWRCELTRKILCGPGSTRTSRVGLVGTIIDLVDGERSLV